MTLSHIIEQLYNSKEVDDCITKMVRQDHRQDFKQELFLKIYDIPESRLVALYERKELKIYIVRCLINLVKNSSSVYNKQYIKPERSQIEIQTDDGEERKTSHVLADNHDPDELNKRIEQENFEQRLVDEINNRFDEEFGTFYYRELVHMIASMGSMRAVSRETGIPIASISEAVKKTRNYLNNKIYNEPKVIKDIY